VSIQANPCASNSYQTKCLKPVQIPILGAEACLRDSSREPKKHRTAILFIYNDFQRQSWQPNRTHEDLGQALLRDAAPFFPQRFPLLLASDGPDPQPIPSACEAGGAAWAWRALLWAGLRGSSFWSRGNAPPLADARAMVRARCLSNAWRRDYGDPLIRANALDTREIRG
jgi:hypothetical protein